MLKTYSKVGVPSQIFELKQQIVNTEQGSSTVTEYYDILKGFLLKLDLYQNLEMETATDIKKLKEIMEQERVFQFLVGLNPKFDQASVQFLGKEPFLSMDEAFALVEWKRVIRNWPLEIQEILYLNI